MCGPFLARRAVRTCHATIVVDIEVCSTFLAFAVQFTRYAPIINLLRIAAITTKAFVACALKYLGVVVLIGGSDGANNSVAGILLICVDALTMLFGVGGMLAIVTALRKSAAKECAWGPRCMGAAS